MDNIHSSSAESFEARTGNAMRAVLSRRDHGAPAATPQSQATLREPVTIAHSGVPRPREFSGSFLVGEFPVDGDRFDERKVLHLTSWPAMREIPADRLIVYARVCALLSLGPSLGFLVHRRLGLPREAVLPVLQTLHADGHLRLARTEGPQAEATDTSPADFDFDFDREATRRSNIWTKLLAKLIK